MVDMRPCKQMPVTSCCGDWGRMNVGLVGLSGVLVDRAYQECGPLGRVPPTEAQPQPTKA